MNDTSRRLKENDKYPKSYWTEIIKSNNNLLSIDLKEIWLYRDLLLLLVKRDFVIYFKQTILGPIWFFTNPILTTALFTLVFGNIAGLSTDGVPRTIFYLSGIIIWNYFSSSFNNTSNVFITNSNLMGKVYFPRLIMPLSVVLSNLMQFAIQFLLFLAFVVYYTFSGQISPNIYILLTPFLALLMVFFAFGLGMIFSSMTTKYKDLIMILPFGIQMFMYATPVIYPLSAISSKYKFLLELNPLSAIIESFRYAFFGMGELNINMLMYSTTIIGIVLILGTIIFNHIQKSFVDTI